MKFRELARKNFERRNIVNGGWHIRDRFIEAGFVDVQRKKKRVYYGDWNGDRHRSTEWQAWKDCFSKIIAPVVMRCFTDDFPNLRDREKFARDVEDDFNSNNYPCYSDMYVLFGKYLTM